MSERPYDIGTSAILGFAFGETDPGDPKDAEFFIRELQKFIDDLARERPRLKLYGRHGESLRLPSDFDRSIIGKVTEKFPVSSCNLYRIKVMCDAVTYCLRDTLFWRQHDALKSKP